MFVDVHLYSVTTICQKKEKKEKEKRESLLSEPLL